MGTYLGKPSSFGAEPTIDDCEDGDDEGEPRLGDRLVGRLAELDIDPVEEVRKLREDE